MRKMLEREAGLMTGARCVVTALCICKERAKEGGIKSPELSIGTRTAEGIFIQKVYPYVCYSTNVHRRFVQSLKTN